MSSVKSFNVGAPYRLSVESIEVLIDCCWNPVEWDAGHVVNLPTVDMFLQGHHHAVE
jgi:hypothetical protein